MVKYEDGCYGSIKGIALIGKVLAGRCKMHYTRVAVGKGTLPEGVSPKTLEEPPEYVMDAMIASVTNPLDGECQVGVQINSANVEKGFYAKWLILYAEDPDDGEVPYTALRLEDEPEWIRPKTSIVGKLAHFDIIAAVGDVDEVFASIDPEALVTVDAVKTMLSEHSRDPEAHADIRKSLADLEAKVGGGVIRAERLDLNIPAEGWEPDTDTDGAFPFRLDIHDAQFEEGMVPILTVLPTSMAVAGACGLCPTSVTGSGYLRLYAKSEPTAEIAASLVVIGDVRGCDDIKVPTTGWVEDEDTGGAFPLHIDVASSIASESLTPMLTVLPGSMEVAGACGLSPVTRTLNGALRLYAKEAPEEPINAVLSLLGTDFPAPAPAPTPGSIPVASRTTLGGVILGPEFNITPGGVMSLNQDNAVTNADLVDEAQVHEDVVHILNEDETK